MSELTDSELDAQIAEKVMGWHESIDYDYRPPQINWVNASGEFERVRNDPRNPENVNSLSGWMPSTDISAAFQVVERLRFGLAFQMFRYPGISSAGTGYLVAFARSISPFDLHDTGRICGTAHAGSFDKLPRAICEAALAALATTEKDARG